MVIQIDTREKSRAISKIIEYFDSNNISHISSKMYVGDYQNLEYPMVVIDRKQDLLELAHNLGKDKKRFLDELKKAKNAGIKIIFLIEHGKGIKKLSDVLDWENPRLKDSPLCLSGIRIYRVMVSLCEYYGCEVQFCDKNETGQRIVEILGGGR